MFASTNSEVFLETITTEKTKIENMFDTSYDSIYKQFQASVWWFLTSLNYQWLVCLWVISDSKLLQQMQNDNKNLKIWFLNTYTNIYADALDIEQKYRIYKDTSVSLFASWITYEWEKERILNALTVLTNNQKNLSNQFQSLYTNKIAAFVKDFHDYSDKNKDLLNTIWTRIQVVKQIEQNYKNLTSQLLEYQIQLAGTWAKFFSKLNILKQASISGLDWSFQNIIDKEINRYKIIPSLWIELAQQKTYALWLYEMQFDEKINMLLDKWYDNKEFSQITKEVQQFISKYNPEWKMQCSNFVSSTDFIQESSRLLKKISDFEKTFSLQNLSNTNTSKFQDAVIKWIPVVIQSQKDITNTFKSAINQKKQSLIDEYKQQNNSSSSSYLNNDLSLQTTTSFQFTQPFKKWQFSEDIKILQQLLTNLWYYKLSLDGVYSTQTIQAVYQYQLANWLLKWYENKPQTWWWMWPATRSQLNKDLLK